MYILEEVQFQMWYDLGEDQGNVEEKIIVGKEVMELKGQCFEQIIWYLNLQDQWQTLELTEKQ